VLGEEGGLGVVIGVGVDVLLAGRCWVVSWGVTYGFWFIPK